MRILHVIGTLNPANGGPPEGVRQLGRAYPKIGVELEVVCQNSPDAPFLANLPFPVHAMGERRFGSFGFSPRLWRWVHQNAPRFDGIVMNGLWIFADIAVRDAALSAHVPYLVFAHGALSPWFRQFRLKHIKKTLYWPLQYPPLRDARSVLFTSAAERDQAAQSFRPNHWRSTCVPYGISEPEGDSCAQKGAFFARIPALRDRRFLLFLSRLVPVKSCDLLLSAFARIAGEFPEVDLVMAGPDRVGWMAALQRQSAEEGTADRVHWPGMLTGDLKWGALRSADALILPSHTENFGVVIVESLAAGRPVLISNQVNISPDILADGAGLVDEDTLEGTERLLRRWLTMPQSERDAIADRTRPCFLSRYSMERAAASIKALFSEPH